MTRARERAWRGGVAELDALDPSRSLGDAFLALSACFDARERTVRAERELARARELLLASLALCAVVITATLLAPGVPDALATAARIAAAALAVWRAVVASERQRDRAAAQEDEARVTGRFGDGLREVELSLARGRAVARR